MLFADYISPFALWSGQPSFPRPSQERNGSTLSLLFPVLSQCGQRAALVQWCVALVCMLFIPSLSRYSVAAVRHGVHSLSSVAASSLAGDVPSSFRMSDSTRLLVDGVLKRNRLALSRALTLGKNSLYSLLPLHLRLVCLLARKKRLEVCPSRCLVIKYSLQNSTCIGDTYADVCVCESVCVRVCARAYVYGRMYVCVHE